MENTETNTNLKYKQMNDRPIYLSLIYSINSCFSIKLNAKVDNLIAKLQYKSNV